jgi:hypothetical protein
MGAANDKVGIAANARARTDTNEPRGFMPFCVDCQPICEPRQNSFLSSCDPNNQGSQVDKASGKHMDASQPQTKARSFRTVDNLRQSSSNAPEAQLNRNASDTQLKRVRSSLSFEGKLPADWDAVQLKKMKGAVEEISNRLRIKPPGPRAMQSVMASRSRGKLDDEIDFNRR